MNFSYPSTASMPRFIHKRWGHLRRSILSAHLAAVLGLLASDACAQSPDHSPKKAMYTTRDIAARLVPLPREGRENLLKRLPGGDGSSSQLAHMLDGDWYLHKGDLTLDGDFESTVNLVVDGDLTVRGNLNDASGDASLVVMGDVRAMNVLSSHLMVTVGSLHAAGIVHADYNDYSFEVWGPKFQARALILTDKSATLPDSCNVEFEYNADSSEQKGRAEDHLREALVRWLDDDANRYKRVTSKKGVQWFDEEGTMLKASEVKSLKITGSVPAPFEDIVAAVYEGQPLFKKASTAFLDWRLDRNASEHQVAAQAKSKNAKDRAAAAAHPQLSKELVTLLVADKEPAVRMAVVHHAKLESEDAAKLAADPEADVRRQLAASQHAVAHLESLIRDTSPEVRRACASHAGLNDEQRRKLLADEVKAVRTRTLRYLPVTAEWVSELRSAKDESLVAWAIEHADEVPAKEGMSAASNAGEWRKDLLDERTAVREAALRQASDKGFLPFMEEHRERFVRDDSTKIRMTLASATRDAKVLETLSQDKDSLVRQFALENLSVPAALLVKEAKRLAAAPGTSWNLTDPGYVDHITAVQSLLQHPRLPGEAMVIIHEVYPKLYRLEPRRDMPLDVILARALNDSPSLEFGGDFTEWKRIAQDAKGDYGRVLGAMLKSDEGYLQSAARMHSLVPLPTLFAHAKAIQDDKYALEEVARNPQMGKPEAAELRAWLMSLNNSNVDSALARNPDVPLDLLKEVAPRAPEYASTTLWQVHGVVLDK